MKYVYLNAFALLVFISTFTAHALTLSEAVDQQLKTISVPCDNFLASGGVPTGTLANDICGRVFPAGSTASSSTDSTVNLDSLSSNIKASNQQQVVHEETQLAPQWTMFATGELERLNRDTTTAEDGYKSNAFRLLGGVTHFLNNQTNVGLALTMQLHKGDYDNGGDFNAKTVGIRAFASHQISEALFIQATAGYDRINSQRKRVATFDELYSSGVSDTRFIATGTPKSDFYYNQTEFSILSGYQYESGEFTLTPQLGINWRNINYGTFSESGESGLELTFHDDYRRSLQGVVGIQATINHSTSYGVLIPELDVSWIREYADKSRTVHVSFTQDLAAKQFSFDTEAGDRNYAEVAAGLSMVLPHGRQLFIRAQTQINRNHYDSRTVNLGFNMEL